MANGHDEEQLDVVERGEYSGTENSMSRDTEAFDRLTPLGGESYRQMLGRTASAPEPTKVNRGRTATPPGMLSRETLKRSEDASMSYRDAEGGLWVVSDHHVGRGWWMLSGLFLAVCGTFALYLFLGPAPSAPVVAAQAEQAPAEADGPKDIQGVKVRQGLQGPPSSGEDEGIQPSTNVPSGDAPED